MVTVYPFLLHELKEREKHVLENHQLHSQSGSC